MTSAFTQNIALEQPANGDYSGDWNLPVNNNMTDIDNMFGSSTTIAVGAGGTITLTVEQAAFHTIILTGTLTANVALQFPQGVGGRRKIWPQIASNPGWNITCYNGPSDTWGAPIASSAGTGSGGAYTPSYPVEIVLTGNRCYQGGYEAAPPGSMVFSYLVPPGYLFTGGQSVSVAQYDLLFAAIGYTYGGSGANFKLPNYETFGPSGIQLMIRY